MPTLALITACDRSIIEEGTKTVSLINLFTGVKISIATERPPANAMIQREWSMVCGWDAETGDGVKVFDQVMDIYWPDGKPVSVGNRSKFSVSEGKRHYMTSKLMAFPIGQVGKYLVQVWAELDGKPVTAKNSFSFAVELIVTPVTQVQEPA